jgi:uncharacterized protein (UPF0548 family)
MGSIPMPDTTAAPRFAFIGIQPDGYEVWAIGTGEAIGHAGRNEDRQRFAVSLAGDVAFGLPSLHDAALWLAGLADVGNGG